MAFRRGQVVAGSQRADWSVPEYCVPFTVDHRNQAEQRGHENKPRDPASHCPDMVLLTLWLILIIRWTESNSNERVD